MVGHHWAPCSCQGRGESLIDPVSESLINHPKSAPGDEREKAGGNGYPSDYVCINHSRRQDPRRITSVWPELFVFCCFFLSLLSKVKRRNSNRTARVLAGCVRTVRVEGVLRKKPRRLSRWHQRQGSLLWLPVIELNKWLRFQWRLRRPSALCLARATADLINF